MTKVCPSEPKLCSAEAVPIPVAQPVATGVPVKPCWWKRDVCGLSTWVWLLILVLLLLAIAWYVSCRCSTDVCEEPCPPVTTPTPVFSTGILKYVQVTGGVGNPSLYDLFNAADHQKVLSGLSITSTALSFDFSKIVGLTPVVPITVPTRDALLSPSPLVGSFYQVEQLLTAGDPSTLSGSMLLYGVVRQSNVTSGTATATTDTTYKVTIPITPAVSAEILAEKAYAAISILSV